MKKIILFAFVFFSILTTVHSQQRETASAPERLQQEKRTDSAIAVRGTQKVKQFIDITPQQEAAIREASVKASQAKRAVFKQYWKTEAFPREMAKAEHLQDSLYESILGIKYYKLYREKLNKEEGKRAYELRVRAQQRKDSITTKPKQP